MEALNGEVHFYWDMIKEKMWNLGKNEFLRGISRLRYSSTRSAFDYYTCHGINNIDLISIGFKTCFFLFCSGHLMTITLQHTR